MASMTRNRGLQPGPLHVEYYSQRAPHAALIVSEHLLIEPQGSEWVLAPVLDSQDAALAWQPVTQAVHAKQGRIFAQLWHAGRCVHPLMQAGLPAMGPSAVKAEGGRFRLLKQYVAGADPAAAAAAPLVGYTTPVAIADPQRYVALYARSAALALEAGFDGVELHAASGFLPHQFLDSGSNQRTDAYGGSPQARCKFVLDVMDALIAVFGKDRTGIKIAPCGGFNDVGMSVSETRATFGHLVRELSARGLAYIQCQRYTEDMDAPRGTKDFDVRELRPLFAGPFVLNGDFSAEEAAQAVARGDCDAVSFASHHLRNPDFATRVRRGQPVKPPTYDHLYGDFFKPEEFAIGYTDQTSYEQECELAESGVVSASFF